MQARRTQSVIALLVEGNWLPISNVIVSQVGKYRYSMYSPHESATVHVVIDVMLVGRIKVISIHSSVWLENSTDLPMRVRLHVPASLLAITPTVEPPPPSTQMVSGALYPSRSASTGAMTRSASRTQGDLLSKRAQHEFDTRRGARDSDRLSRSTEPGGTPDVMLRILRPGQGQYLPLAAVLQGSLSITAQGPIHPVSSTRAAWRAIHACVIHSDQRCSLPNALYVVWQYAHVCISGLHGLRGAGHYENQRDVLQLSNDLAALPEQQGYLQCMSLPSAAAAGGETQQPQHNIDPARLTHFFLRVSNKMRAHGDLSTLAQFDQVNCRYALHYSANQH